jgi:hypothetical protein
MASSRARSLVQCLTIAPVLIAVLLPFCQRAPFDTTPKAGATLGGRLARGAVLYRPVGRLRPGEPSALFLVASHVRSRALYRSRPCNGAKHLRSVFMLTNIPARV